MKKALSVLLAVALTLSLSVSALAAAPAAPSVTTQTVAWPVVKGSDTAPANKATIYRYTPADFRFRGNSTPVIFVLGDAAWTEASANEALVRGGFDKMAEDESGHIVFVSPANGKSWTKDDYALMQALATNVTDDYTYEQELKGAYKTGVGEDGRLFAGRFRSYTFAEGSAQAFVKQYLDTPDATYLVAEWNNDVDGFGAGFHYADNFTREGNLNAWEGLRRVNRISMSSGVTYLDSYHVYSDYGIAESRNDFSTKAGKNVNYYQYVPTSVNLESKTEKYPLVFVLHGGGQHPEGYVQLSNWPVVAARENFMVVAVNAHYLLDQGDIIELLDSLLARYPIDASRVYSTGYSMGGVTSWNLGINHTERFAAIAPTEAVPGGTGDFPLQSAPSQIIPTFFIGGEDEFLPVFPMQTPNAIKTLSLIAQANGFEYDGTYNAGLEKYYGMNFDNTYLYGKRPSAGAGEGVWTIHDIKSADGNVYTKLSSVSKLGHSAYPIAAEHIWEFFEQFSRKADGTIQVHSAPAVTGRTVGWPVVKGSEAAPAKTATYYHYAPSDFRFRGNSTPVIFVLGDTAWTEQSANDALTRGGFDQMSKDESGHIVFVSPSNGKSWSKDDYALMQALATNITDDYEYAEEQQGLYDSGFAADGRMLAGRFRSYTYAEGSAQAFVKQYLDTPEATYWVAQWSNTVDGFGAGFHYTDKFSREDNLKAWEGLRRTNRLSMSDGYSYVGPYSVYSDYGIDETRHTYAAPSGAAFEYLQYIPKTVDTSGSSGKYPLVMVFHGRAMNIDGYMHLMDWPVVGSQKGFITIGVNGNQTNADILALIDSLCAQYPIDTTRVYSTGYSMGGMKSWSLGFEETARFAAIAPTEAIPGMGNSAIPFTVPSQKIPTFAIWGEAEFFNLFPMNTPYAIDLISLLGKTNGFAYNGKYDETLGKYFGMTTGRTYTYNRAPATHGDAGVWSIHEMLDDQNVPSTLLSSVSALGHSAWMPSAERIWSFFTHFSRAADGTSVYTATPYADVPTKSWYTSAVAHALDNGLMTGAGNTFAPNAALTADDLTAALYALAGPPAESAAAWAKANNLPTGTDALTRGQAADAMLAFGKALGSDTSAAADLTGFTDGASASDGMRWAVGAGLVTGKSGGKLDAGAPASRAEGAVMLQRLNLLLAK